jgi:hypothetical protein
MCTERRNLLYVIENNLYSPTSAANPLTNVNVPKPEVKRSTPAISTMAGGVSAHQADKKHPNMAETTTNPQKSEQNGIARGAIAPRPKMKK